MGQRLDPEGVCGLHHDCSDPSEILQKNMEEKNTHNLATFSLLTIILAIIIYSHSFSCFTNTL